MISYTMKSDQQLQNDAAPDVLQGRLVRGDDGALDVEAPDVLPDMEAPDGGGAVTVRKADLLELSARVDVLANFHAQGFDLLDTDFEAVLNKIQDMLRV